MGLLAFGLNHRTAAVELRERVSFDPSRLDQALFDLRNRAGLQEAAILSTCNRTELYCASPHGSAQPIVDWLSEYHQLQSYNIHQMAYEHWGEGAVKHMMRVASGLDSLVLGEPQILGQLKSAYNIANEAKTIGPELSRLFQSSFSVAKQVRTETEIGMNPVSVASAAVSLAKHIFTDLSQSKVLMVGAGETIELVARHLRQHNVTEMTFANRTLERAIHVAAEFGGHPVTLEAIPEILPKVDIVVASTASPIPVIGKGTVEKALKKRKHKPIFMIDIAVPRDIEAEVGDLDDIYLYTVDDLQETVEENRKAREEVAEKAEQIIELRCLEFMQQLKELGAVDTIKRYRQSVEAIREQELAKALNQLNSGGNPEEVLQKMSRALANKVMHQPSLEIKKATVEGRYELIEWVHHLFGLNDHQDK